MTRGNARSSGRGSRYPPRSKRFDGRRAERLSIKVPGTWVLMFRITIQFSLSSGGVPSANRAIASSSRFSFSE